MQRRIMAIFTTLLVAIALIVALPGSSSAHDGRLLSAKLSGANEVPPADPDGSGSATVLLRDDSVCFTLRWADINAPFAGHIHRGGAGINGPIVVPFFQKTPATPLPASLSSAAGCVGGVDPALIREIRSNPAGFYVNLHTADFPGGVIRDQLKVAKGLDLNVPTQFHALLLGRNEVPAADPDGFGLGLVSAHGDRVCFVVSWANIQPPFAGHIHRGAAGVNGPIVVPFFQSTPADPLPATFNAADGCIPGVDKALIREIRHNPSAFYVNLHTADFPGGVIRGQLRRGF
jgi:hypothetical protein